MAEIIKIGSLENHQLYEPAKPKVDPANIKRILEPFNSLRYNNYRKEKPEPEDPGNSEYIDSMVPFNVAESGFSGKTEFAMHEQISQYSGNESLSLEDFSNKSYKNAENKKPEAETSGLKETNISKVDTSNLSNSNVSVSDIQCNREAEMSQDFFENSENKSQRFIKYIPSEKVDWLQEHYPNAFLLLALIARTARRTNDIPDGLLPGDAIIGEIETSRKAGMTRKQYRTALEKLIEFGFLEVVFNPKNEKCQKRAIKRTIKSYVVNLCNSSIYDINQNTSGDQNGELRANKGRTEGDKLRMNKKEEKEKRKKKKKPDKPAYAPSAEAEELLYFFISSLKIHIPEIPDPEKSLTSDNICSVRPLDQLLKSYSPEEIRRVITFSHTHRFWSQHVHKPSYLKSKFPTLLAAYRRDIGPPSYAPKVDRRTLNKDGTPMHSPFEDKF